MKNIKCKNCKNLVNDWCDVKCDSPDTELVRNCTGFEQMTNGDRIRAMSDEELAKFLDDCNSHGCVCPARDCRATCYECIVDLLKQPAEVDDE